MAFSRIPAVGDPFAAGTQREDRTAACENCGSTAPRSKLVLVTPGNSDGWMHPYGVRLCRSCARRSGVAY